MPRRLTLAIVLTSVATDRAAADGGHNLLARFACGARIPHIHGDGFENAEQSRQEKCECPRWFVASGMMW